MIRPARLQEARERAVLTQSDVAAALDVPREVISYWETGGRTPSPNQLHELAQLYRVNEGYLRGEERLDERRGREVLYRRLPKGDQETRHELEVWLDFLDAWATYKRQHRLDVAGAKTPPRTLNEGYVEDVRRASKLATNVRAYYALGDEPLPDLRTFLEELGVLVYKAPLGRLAGTKHGVSGAFYNHPDLGWAILVNSNTTEGRQRFTLAHEFAHALYHREVGGIISRLDQAETDKKERFANAFAAHLLVPGSTLRDHVRHYGGRERLRPLLILKLSAYFRVSYSTLLWRLLGENLISREQLDAFRTASVLSMANQLNLDTSLYTRPPKALWPDLERFPFAVLESIKRHIDENETSIQQAASVLAVGEHDIQGALLVPATEGGDGSNEEGEFPFVFA